MNAIGLAISDSTLPQDAGPFPQGTVPGKRLIKNGSQLNVATTSLGRRDRIIWSGSRQFSLENDQKSSVLVWRKALSFLIAGYFGISCFEIRFCDVEQLLHGRAP